MALRVCLQRQMAATYSSVMADDLTPTQRSYAMSRVRSRGNKSTELRLARLLRERCISGWRRHESLPGRPDFAFRRERVAIFVDGCFWHRCPRCFRMPSTNIDYWEAKTARNVERDRRTTRELKQGGWVVVRIWEHSLDRPNVVASRIQKALMRARGASALPEA